MPRLLWIVIVLLALWVSAIVLRLPAWSSDRALWAATVQTVPQQARAWVNHCGAEAKAGELDTAWSACQRAIGLTFSPDRPAVRQATERAKAEALQALILATLGHRAQAQAILDRLSVTWPDLEGLAAYREAIEKGP